MKVTNVILHFQPGKTSIGGNTFIAFTEGDAYPDLHYIVREGQHVVNFTGSCGKRMGMSFPAFDIRQVSTALN